MIAAQPYGVSYGIVNFEIKLRLADIDAFEISGTEREKGLAAKSYLESLILGKDVWIVTQKDRTEKYGRYLATIYIQTIDGFVNVNALLVENGHAVVYTGK